MAVVPADKQFKGWTHNQVINEVPVPPKRLGEKQDEGSGPAIFAKEARLGAFRQGLAKMRSFLPGRGPSLGSGLSAARKVGVTPDIRRGQAAAQTIAAGGGQFPTGPEAFTPTGAFVNPQTGKPEVALQANQGLVNRNALESYYGSAGQGQLIRDLEAQGMKFTGTDKFIAGAADVIKNPWVGMGVPLAMQFIPAGKDEYGNERTLGQTGVGQAVSTALPFAQLYKGRYQFTPQGTVTGLKDRNFPTAAPVAGPVPPAAPPPPAPPAGAPPIIKTSGLVSAFQKVAALI